MIGTVVSVVFVRIFRNSPLVELAVRTLSPHRTEHRPFGDFVIDSRSNARAVGTAHGPLFIASLGVDSAICVFLPES